MARLVRRSGASADAYVQALACTFRDSCRAWGCRSCRHVAVGVLHRPIVYQSLRAGVSAIGWKLDVGEGLSPVAPCRSILEAPNPARVQHVDQRSEEHT